MKGYFGASPIEMTYTRRSVPLPVKHPLYLTPKFNKMKFFNIYAVLKMRFTNVCHVWFMFTPKTLN